MIRFIYFSLLENKKRKNRGIIQWVWFVLVFQKRLARKNWWKRLEKPKDFIWEFGAFICARFLPEIYPVTSSLLKLANSTRVKRKRVLVDRCFNVFHVSPWVEDVWPPFLGNSFAVCSLSITPQKVHMACKDGTSHLKGRMHRDSMGTMTNWKILGSWVILQMHTNAKMARKQKGENLAPVLRMMMKHDIPELIIPVWLYFQIQNLQFRANLPANLECIQGMQTS